MNGFQNAIKLLPRETDKKWETFRNACHNAGVRLPATDAFEPEIKCVLAFSEFVVRISSRNPQIIIDLWQNGNLHRQYESNFYSKHLNQGLSAVADEPALSLALRIFRNREMVRIAWRDLTGQADLDETLKDLSGLAAACLDQALLHLYRWQCQKDGTPHSEDGQAQRLTIIGMGKLGAAELNFSSDIDLVFAFAEKGQTRGGKRSIANIEFFTRLCRSLIKTIGQNTAEGFVFRVDTRLRPDGDNGPLVLSFDAMEDYYQSQGRDWERYAWIKARPVAGDKASGAALLKRLKPFVYRRYLDFSTIDALRQMKQKIELEIRRQKGNDDIKLGLGGIREVEFFGQIFQLLRGGVTPALQQPAIQKVLAVLADLGHINSETCQAMLAAYRFLRRIENRLQAHDDSQIHKLPANMEGRLRIATSMGFSNWEHFAERLNRHRQIVHDYFAALLSPDAPEKTSPAATETGLELSNIWPTLSDDAKTLQVLETAGFKKPQEALGHLETLRDATTTRALSSEGRRRLDLLIPRLLAELAGFEQASMVLGRVLELIQTIQRRTTYLALLLENPTVLTHLIRLTRASAWIASFLSRHPALLDELFDPRTLYAPPQKDELKELVKKRLAPLSADDLEYQMEALSLFKQINVLRVAAADISGALPLMNVSDRLSEIAETILDEVVALCFDHLVKKHGRPACTAAKNFGDRGFAVIAYGKLGGLELGYGSDLDLVFLHAGSKGLTTSAKQAIDETTFFARLGQRVLHILTAHTPAGNMYEADMRLRPNGSSGMLVSHIEGFRTYQLNDAWTWEHQALIRARAVSGDPAIMARFETIRNEVLVQNRKSKIIAEKVCEMRERMRAEKLDATNTDFDLKESPGGLVDIEFIVQYLVLVHAAACPAILNVTDNVRLIHALSTAGVLKKDDAGLLRLAYLCFRSKIHRLNLQKEPSQIPLGQFNSLRAGVFAIWKQLFAT
jgi:[glutamine synthetase] adenylyltransferase / [glutamine synthetase]-adenylyl-L-tyrosine phosphorylase